MPDDVINGQSLSFFFCFQLPLDVTNHSVAREVVTFFTLPPGTSFLRVVISPNYNLSAIKGMPLTLQLSQKTLKNSKKFFKLFGASFSDLCKPFAVKYLITA